MSRRKKIFMLLSIVILALILGVGSHTNQATAQISPNLLANPSFEAGNHPASWAWNGGSCNRYAYNDSTTAYHGSYYLATNRSGDYQNCQSFYQDVNQTPIVGQTYRFAIWARSSNGATRNGHIALWATGGNAQNNNRAFSVSGSTWQCIEIALSVTNSGNTTLKPEIYLDSPDGADYFFDNAILQQGGSTSCPTQVGQPDLKPTNTSIQSPAPYTPGATIQARAQIMNAGNASASASSIGFWVSTAANGNPIDTKAVLPVSTLAAGSTTAYQSVTLRIPSGLNPGTYYLVAEADSDSTITESNEANNRESVAFQLQTASGIDLKPTGLSIKSNAPFYPGSTIGVEAQVQNAGNLAASQSLLGYWVAQTPNGEPIDVGYKATNPLANLASGTSSDLAYEDVNIPFVGISPGTYYIVFEADTDNTISEVNEDNNRSSLPFTIQACAAGTLYCDVPQDHTFGTEIEALFGPNITQGCRSGTEPYNNRPFCPDALVNRGMMAAFLVKRVEGAAFNPAQHTYRGYFVDVPATSTWAPWVERLYELGITTGCQGSVAGPNPGADLRFCPDYDTSGWSGIVTRAAIALFLANTEKWSLTPTQGIFVDVTGNNRWEQAVEYMYRHGYTGGASICQNSANGGGLTYCPNDYVHRGMAAAFMARAFGYTAPPAPTGTHQLLVNPSFEKSSIPHPWRWLGRTNNNFDCNQAIYRDNTIARPGGTSYLATNRTANFADCYSFYQDLTNRTLTKGETYTFGIWVRSAIATPRRGTVTLWALGGDAEKSSTTFTNVGPTWQYVQTTLTLQQENHDRLRVEIYLESEDGIDYFFDDAALWGAPRFSINGQITLNGQPLPRISVTTDKEHRTETDSEGKYAIGELVPGVQYVITAHAGSWADYVFSPKSHTVAINEEEGNVTRNFAAEVYVPPTYAISGQVFDNSDADDVELVDGVEIFIGSRVVAETGQDGKYTITGLTEGTYTLRSSKARYIFDSEREVTVNANHPHPQEENFFGKQIALTESLPDLIPAIPSGSSQPIFVSPLESDGLVPATIEIAVENIGDATAYNVAVTLYMTMSREFGTVRPRQYQDITPMQEVKTWQINSIPPGKKVTRSIEHFMCSGGYEMKLVVNSDQKIVESVSGNNTYHHPWFEKVTGQIPIAQKPESSTDYGKWNWMPCAQSELRIDKTSVPGTIVVSQEFAWDDFHLSSLQKLGATKFEYDIKRDVNVWDYYQWNLLGDLFGCKREYHSTLPNSEDWGSEEVDATLEQCLNPLDQTLIAAPTLDEEFEVATGVDKLKPGESYQVKAHFYPDNDDGIRELMKVESIAQWCNGFCIFKPDKYDWGVMESKITSTPANLTKNALIQVDSQQFISTSDLSTITLLSESVYLVEVSDAQYLQSVPNFDGKHNLVSELNLNYQRAVFLDDDRKYKTTITLLKPINEEQLKEILYDVNIISAKFVSYPKGVGTLPYPHDPFTLSQLQEDFAAFIEETTNVNNGQLIAGYVAAEVVATGAALKALIRGETAQSAVTTNAQVLSIDVGPVEYLSQYPDAILIPGENIYYAAASLQPPAVGFEATSVTGQAPMGQAPLTVRFAYTSTGVVTNWAWDFGDGNTSGRQFPTHTYYDPGTYTVTLTASGPGGTDTVTRQNYIVVVINPTALPTDGEPVQPQDKRVFLPMITR